MCNLSEGILNRGIEQGILFSLNSLLSDDEELTPIDAIKKLKIPSAEHSKYLELLATQKQHTQSHPEGGSVTLFNNGEQMNILLFKWNAVNEGLIKIAFEKLGHRVFTYYKEVISYEIDTEIMKEMIFEIHKNKIEK